MSIVNTYRPCNKCLVPFTGIRCVTCKNASAAKQRALNPDREKSRYAKWSSLHPGEAVARATKWNSENPDVRREITQNRRAKIKSIGGILSKGLALKLFALQKGKCACCGLPLSLGYHMDHIMPLALGGLNVDSNMQLLRQRCNNQKSARHPIDFMQSRGFLL